MVEWQWTSERKRRPYTQPCDRKKQWDSRLPRWGGEQKVRSNGRSRMKSSDYGRLHLCGEVLERLDFQDRMAQEIRLAVWLPAVSWLPEEPCKDLLSLEGDWVGLPLQPEGAGPYCSGDLRIIALRSFYHFCVLERGWVTGARLFFLTCAPPGPSAFLKHGRYL